MIKFCSFAIQQMLHRWLICDSIHLLRLLTNPASTEAGTHSSYLDEGPHGEKVGQHGGEPLSQAALSNEAELQLRQTNGIVSLLPGPAGDVEQVSLQREDTHTHVHSCKHSEAEPGRAAGTSKTPTLLWYCSI